METGKQKREEEEETKRRRIHHRGPGGYGEEKKGKNGRETQGPPSKNERGYPVEEHGDEDYREERK